MAKSRRIKLIDGQYRTLTLSTLVYRAGKEVRDGVRTCWKSGSDTDFEELYRTPSGSWYLREVDLINGRGEQFESITPDQASAWLERYGLTIEDGDPISKSELL